MNEKKLKLVLEQLTILAKNQSEQNKRINDLVKNLKCKYSMLNDRIMILEKEK